MAQTAATSLQALVRTRIKERLAALPARPTQYAIAEALGLGQTWVSHYLSGRHDIDLDKLAAFAAFLRVDPATLVKDGGAIKHTVAPDIAEALTLFQALSEKERGIILETMRALTRPVSEKRARR